MSRNAWPIWKPSAGSDPVVPRIQKDHLESRRTGDPGPFPKEGTMLTIAALVGSGVAFILLIRVMFRGFDEEIERKEAYGRKLDCDLADGRN